MRQAPANNIDNKESKRTLQEYQSPSFGTLRYKFNQTSVAVSKESEVYFGGNVVLKLVN